MNASMSVQRFSMCLGISALHRKHTPATWRTCQHAAGRRSRSVATSKRVFALCAMQHMSVADTVLQCIAHKDKRHMLKLKNDFRLSDRRWCWLQVRVTLHPQHARTRKHARKHKLCARARTRQACVEHACRRQRRNVAWKAELAAVCREVRRSPLCHSKRCSGYSQYCMRTRTPVGDGSRRRSGRSADSYSLIALRSDPRVRQRGRLRRCARQCVRACG